MMSAAYRPDIRLETETEREEAVLIVEKKARVKGFKGTP